jgi:hypothetical protein
MPQLPSGIHVAIDTAPLTELLKNWHAEGASEKLSDLQSIEDLYPLTRILELVPAEQEDAPIHLVQGSLKPPQSMATRDTGYRLIDCPDGLPCWSPQDKEAFRDFVKSRVPAVLKAHLETARQNYADITKNFVQRLEKAWLKAGVHPSQEPGWDDWPESPQIDVFDQLVALLQCRDAIAAAVSDDVPVCNAVNRLDGFLSMAAGSLHWLPKAGLPAMPTAQLADALRTAVEPGAFEQDRRDWWVAQVSIECNNLFNEPALESFLMTNAPKAYGVIRLAAISKPDGKGA